MLEFFNIEDRGEILIPMYGTIHLISLASMVLLILVCLWKRESIRKMMQNPRFLKRAVIIYMAVDYLYWILMWAYKVEPLWERFPLHLCPTLSILIPIFILTDNDQSLQFVSGWAMAAGFISMVNPSFLHFELWSFAFIHYILRHFFLFFIPLLLTIGREQFMSYIHYCKSFGILVVYAGIIFLLDWATGANYMHLGQHNPLAIPFLPGALSQWPWTYPSFIVVGAILLNLMYLLLIRFKQREERTISDISAQEPLAVLAE